VSHHGAQVRGQAAVPRSALFEGRFGRMFRTLSPLDPGAAAIRELAGQMRDAAAAPAGDNPAIPAGYTYLGQFIDHDITFDPMSQLQKRNDPDALVDFRTPRFDLDSLYGSGPADSPFLYESTRASKRGVELLVGVNPDDERFEPHDLPRNQQGRALIGDPRNDVHIVVSQLHLLFIRFHNKVVERIRQTRPELTGGALLAECQRVVRWHYQWIVAHDFLRKVTGIDVDGFERAFFTWANAPFMPVEFSGAAYRFGHSMVRPAYDLNDTTTDVPVFAEAEDPDPDTHLGGFRRLPFGWTVDWSRFFKTTGRTPQHSRRIDTKLSAPLSHLPSGVDAERRALAYLNLRRGVALGLPSGQDVAHAMGRPPLDGLDQPTPLWYYLLREAEEQAGGEHLGPVGGRIVAEVLIGLLEGDPQSYLHQEPQWTPVLPSAHKGDFTMADLVTFTLG
jgi:hypothetical protein